MRIRSSVCLLIARASVVLTAIGLPSAGSAAIQFSTTYQTIPSATSATWVRALDINGDGLQDLVVLGSSKSVWYHRRLPGGGYAPASPLVTFPGVVVLWDTGDINNDGRIDLVVADATNTAWSALGNGDGTFQTPQGVLSLFWGACLKLGHLDGDGRLDIVAAVTFGPLYTMKGLGDGRFQLTSIMYPPPVFPGDLAIADFDGDSKGDVIAVDRESNTVDFFRGLPGGLLDLPVALPMPGTPSFINVADLDEDGFPDAMVVSSQFTTNVISIIYGAPVGTPFGRVDVPREGLRNLSVVDVDGGGHLELLAAEGYPHVDEVVIFGRTGPRAYAVLRDYAGGTQTCSPVLTDTNGDGQRDIVACNPARSELAVLHGHGGLNFGDGVEVRTVKMSGLDIGDLNGDQAPDIVTVKAGSDRVAGVHLGAGDGTFLPMFSTVGPPGCCGHEAARLVDMNGDGRLDLVGLRGFSPQLDVLPGDGLGHFASGTSRALGSEPHSSFALSDFNADGRPDAAVACDAGVAICLNTPTGEFGAPTFVPGQAKGVATADFNGDGRADLIATNSAVDYEFGSQIPVYLGHGDGTFTALPTFYGGYKPTTFAVADMNGDGITDLAIGNLGDRTIALFLGAGDGTFVTGVLLPDLQASSIEFADLDGNGVLDLIATLYDRACVRVWPGLGSGVFGSPLSFGTRSYPGELRVADLNHDGRPDLVVGRLYRDVVDVLLNQTVGYPVPTLVSNVEATVRAGHVRLVWYSVAPELRRARVERATDGGWQDVGEVRTERLEYATFEEDLPNGDYDYRLALNLGGNAIRTGGVHIVVRTTASLAIDLCRWDDSVHAFGVTLSLMGPSPARFQIVDVLGRIVADDRWVPAGAGTEGRVIESRSRTASGVYWARLSQDGRAVTRRVIVLE